MENRDLPAWCIDVAVQCHAYASHARACCASCARTYIACAAVVVCVRRYEHNIIHTTPITPPLTCIIFMSNAMGLHCKVPLPSVIWCRLSTEGIPSVLSLHHITLSSLCSPSPSPPLHPLSLLSPLLLLPLLSPHSRAD